MIGKFEANKDMIQELTSSGAHRVGNIAGIITGTVAEVTREIGEWVTDVIEMNEAAAAARRDNAPVHGDEGEAVAADPGAAVSAEEAPRSAATGDRADAENADAAVVDADVTDDPDFFGTQR